MEQWDGADNGGLAAILKMAESFGGTAVSFSFLVLLLLGQ
jgi:hypothetical protein